MGSVGCAFKAYDESSFSDRGKIKSFKTKIDARYSKRKCSEENKFERLMKKPYMEGGLTVGTELNRESSSNDSRNFCNSQSTKTLLHGSFKNKDFTQSTHMLERKSPAFPRQLKKCSSFSFSKNRILLKEPSDKNETKFLNLIQSDENLKLNFATEDTSMLIQELEGRKLQKLASLGMDNIHEDLSLFVKFVDINGPDKIVSLEIWNSNLTKLCPLPKELMKESVSTNMTMTHPDNNIDLLEILVNKVKLKLSLQSFKDKLYIKTSQLNKILKNLRQIEHLKMDSLNIYEDEETKINYTDLKNLKSIELLDEYIPSCKNFVAFVKRILICIDENPSTKLEKLNVSRCFKRQYKDILQSIQDQAPHLQII